MLNEKMAKLENDISQTGKLDKDEAMLVMYLAFFNEDSIYNIKALYKTVDTMDKKLKNRNDYIVELEAKIKILELESHQTKIILKNVPLMDEKDNRENYNSTRNTVMDLLSFSNLELNSITDFYRLYSKKESPSNPSKKPKLDGKSPPILISFSNTHDLGTFTKNLAKMKRIKVYEKLVMEFSCPFSLKIDYISACKEAYRLRNEKKLVTRCKITKSGIKLFARSKDETKFNEVAFQKN